MSISGTDDHLVGSAGRLEFLPVVKRSGVGESASVVAEAGANAADQLSGVSQVRSILIYGNRIAE